jgi:hypothetical protein
MNEEPPYYLKYPLHETPRLAMQAFLRATIETPPIGGANYTFRISGTSKLAAQKFVQNVRVAISRLRKQAIANDLPMAKFVISVASMDPITKITKAVDTRTHETVETVACIGYLIQLERRKKQRRAVPQASYTDFIYLLELPSTSSDEIKNTRLADIVEELALNNSYKFDAANWLEMLSAFWLLDKNFVVYKGYNPETNEHEIGRY